VDALRYGTDNEAVRFSPHTFGPLEISLDLYSESAQALRSLAITIYDQHGTKLINADSVSLGQVIDLHAGQNTVRLRIAALYLVPGVYTLGWWLADTFGAIYDFVEAAINIEVVEFEPNPFGAQPVSDGTVACRFEYLEARPGSPT
jgi:hypothetical protein